MPCDSRITIELKLDPARLEVLAAAMKTLGYEAKGAQEWWAPGTVVRLSGTDLQISAGQDAPAIRGEIQRATSVEVVKAAAARNGWQLNWLAGGNGLKAEAVKMTYGR
jgi:hypothetical protein